MTMTPATAPEPSTLPPPSPVQAAAAGNTEASRVEDAVQQILTLRRQHGTSGQRGEDVALIRAALAQRNAPSQSTPAEVV